MVAEKLTVVQILPEFDEGGVEGETLDLAMYLASEGHRSIVISGGGRLVPKLEKAGCLHLLWSHIGEKSPRCLPYIGRLRKFLPAERVDVLHLRSRLPAWVGYLAWKLLPERQRPALITSFHGFHSVNGYSAIMAKGQKVIAVSQVIKQHILDNYKIDAARISLIHGGFDSRQFSPQAVSEDRIQQLRQSWLAGDGDVPIIILPGRLTKLKGQDILIESLALLKKQPFICLLIGDTGEHLTFTEKLREQIGFHGLEEKVRLVGHCSDMPAAYLLADLVVSASSTHPEAFGKVAIEAMAMGKPVIGTAHGGSLETIVPGETGWLVPPMDAKAMSAAILEALLDPKERKRLGRQGREWVKKHFTAESMCRKTVDLYFEACKETNK